MPIILVINFQAYTLTLAGISRPSSAQRREGVDTTPSRLWLLIELGHRGRNERVGLHEKRKPMVSNFKVSAQPMT